MARSHLLHGVTIGSWWGAALPVPDHIAMGAGLVAAGCAILPDIDHDDSLLTRKLGPLGWPINWAAGLFGGHRGWTPTPFGAVIFAVPVWIYTAFLAGDAGAYWWVWGLSVIVGCLTHRWGDCRTVGGCLPATWLPGHPKRRRVTYGATFVTGSTRERELRRDVYRRFAAGSFVAALVLQYGLVA
jgi:membrane-bound metal-dependent hydrolase YbcI (DUF457 family)